MAQPAIRARKTQLVTIEGRELKLTNLEKVLYPEVGFTKANVIVFYLRIAPVLLPHIQGRPTTLKRYPDGVDGEFFYEKYSPKYRPEWATTAEVWSEGNKRVMHYCQVDSTPMLAWIANLAGLELHTSLALAQRPDRPTAMVFDLDPGPGTDVVECCIVALQLRELFTHLGLECCAKTSGSKGLQMYVPLSAHATFDATREFSRTIALTMEHAHPNLVVSRMAKALRNNKVLIDWSQNDEHKTTVCAYSLRAKSRPTVSTPVTWAEVEATANSGKADELAFTSDEVLARVERDGDLFAPLLTLKQRLPNLAAAVRAMGE
ncbi:MAG: ATP-dependent DNA ligase [Thermoleophilia bacterium]|nr:ATP-dependent DNA ligase [Thermoleophilia bacterium]